MQYGKVEICGVNTSQLKLLKESEKRELLNTIRNGSPAEKKMARDKMINGNLRLVLSVIQRFTNRGENPDDLFRWVLSDSSRRLITLTLRLMCGSAPTECL